MRPMSEPSEIPQQARTERGVQNVASVENAFLRRIPTVLQNRTGLDRGCDVRCTSRHRQRGWRVALRIIFRKSGPA
jgi:hypothetical protein